MIKTNFGVGAYSNLFMDKSFHLTANAHGKIHSELMRWVLFSRSS